MPSTNEIATTKENWLKNSWSHKIFSGNLDPTFGVVFPIYNRLLTVLPIVTASYVLARNGYTVSLNTCSQMHVQIKHSQVYLQNLMFIFGWCISFIYFIPACYVYK